MKTCSKCKETKPKTEFHKSRSRKDGLSYYCKMCKANREKDYRKNNLEKVKAKGKQRRKNFSEQVKAEKKKIYVKP